MASSKNSNSSFYEIYFSTRMLAVTITVEEWRTKRTDGMEWWEWTVESYPSILCERSPRTHMWLASVCRVSKYRPWEHTHTLAHTLTPDSWVGCSGARRTDVHRQMSISVPLNASSSFVFYFTPSPSLSLLLPRSLTLLLFLSSSGLYYSYIVIRKHFTAAPWM